MSQILKVVGVSFRPNYPDNLFNLVGLHTDEEAIEIELRREPTNPYDSNAIMVLVASTGEHLGYLPKTVNEPIAQAMDAGVAYASSVEYIGAHEKDPRRPGLVISIVPIE